MTGSSDAERDEELAEVKQEVGLLLDALWQISEIETPGSNATVRRMAQIARDAIRQITHDPRSSERAP